MRFYSADELRTAIDLDDLIAALEAGHGGARPEIADALIGPLQSRYLVRSAHDGLALAGSKLITIVPENPAKRGLAAVQAVIVLFDCETGVPIAALDATELTYWKTAADSALGSRILSRPDAKSLLIVGAGGLAPWLARGHLAARPEITEVSIWNRSRDKTEALAAQLCGEGMPARAAFDLEAAARQADIVSTATMATDPILKGAWLKPGTHVDLVGGYAPDTREADDDVMRRGALFVDSRQSALDGVGDVLAPIANGVISEKDIRGDLFDLVGNMAQGRDNAEEITVYKNAGGAHLDLMVAAALVRRLEARGA